MSRTTAMVFMLCVAVLATSGCRSVAAAPPPAATPWATYEDPGKVLAASDLQPADPTLLSVASSAKRLTYTSRSAIYDSTTHVTGSVFVPRGAAPPGGWPIVALGHPTGTSPDCAPSAVPDLLDTAAVKTLLQAGYLVAITDYQGLGDLLEDKTYHPYLDSTTAGYNLIDSVRAARSLVPDASERWVALGASQGGQAAWAANELDQDYGWGLQLLGSASLSPFTDINGLADAAAADALTKDQQLVLQRFLAALDSEYGDKFNLDDYRRGVVKDQWDVLSACQGPASQERARVVEEIAPDELRPSSPAATDTLRGYLQKTSLPQGPTAAPMLVIYGGQDSLTPPAWTEQALNRACQMGDAIQIQMRPDSGHDQIDPSEAFDWVSSRFNDVAADNDCESFTATGEAAG